MDNAPIEVKDFVFNSLSGDSSPRDVKSAKFAPLEHDAHTMEKRGEELSREEKLADTLGFKILDLAQEQNERKNRIKKDREEKLEDEISSRLKLVEKETYDKAHEEGVMAGKEEISTQLKVDAQEQLNILTTLVDELLASKDKMYQEQKNQLLFMVNNLVKWVILRELKDDGNYLETLMEKLVSELQTQTNLNIQVNKKDFEKMPEVLESIQKKIGELKNVRLVIDYDLPEKGMVIDSDNGMIKCTKTEQFNALDGLFEKIGVFKKDFEDE